MTLADFMTHIMLYREMRYLGYLITERRGVYYLMDGRTCMLVMQGNATQVYNRLVTGE